MHRYLFAPLTLVLALGSAASASQIGSGSIAKKSYNVHETITEVAQECLAAYGGALPSDCSDRFGQVLERIRLDRAETPRGVDPEPAKIRYASRWPDDPVRMLDKARSQIRFGLKMLDGCKTALNKGPDIDRVGLLCASHYGRLQFMHAQAPAIDRGDPAAVRRKILAWADFAYAAATDSVFRNSEYCGTVAGLRSAELKRALTFSPQSSFCEAPWRVATLFALRCQNPFQEKKCWERKGDADDNDVARIAAIGALLHLVQDSFSQSHVARMAPNESPPGPRGPFAPRSVCAAPSAYYDYQQQAYPTPDDTGHIPEDPHAAADYPPELDATCRDPRRSVDDVVTASAVVLYYAGNPANRDPAAFSQYMATRVFPYSGAAPAPSGSREN